VKRPFLTFLVGVVVPCGIAMLVTANSASKAWSDLYLTSHTHVGRMVLSAFEEDLASAVSELATEVEPFPDADPSVPAIQRAMTGDTVTGLLRTTEGVELMVTFGDTSLVFYGARVIRPTAANQVARASGYEAAMYFNGGFWGGTESFSFPGTLDEAVLLEAASNRGGVRLPGAQAVLQAASPRAGTPAPLAAMAAPRRPPEPSVERRAILVLALLLVFSCLVGWIQLARPPTSENPRRPGPWSIGILALVPALTATLFLVHLTRNFEVAAAEATIRDLTRGLAVAGARGSSESTFAVHSLTGFHSTLVRQGEILETTFASRPTEISGLPAPPPSFTTSGMVATPEGPSLYVALRRGEGTVMIATAPLPAVRVADFRQRCTNIGLALWVWLVLAGALLLLRATRPVSSSPRDPQDQEEE
jgi:hypothetical protein